MVLEEVMQSPLEIQQGLREGFQLREGQGLDAGFLLSRKGSAAALQLAQGQGGSFRLPAFCPSFVPAFPAAFLQAKAKDFLVGDAAGEVVECDATHGADVGDGAAVEA
jgi:hypothetical protein